MTLKPGSISELQESLSQSRRVAGVSLEAVAQLIEHVPEDMTATVQAGMSLADFQAHLAKAGQWLPIDPPNPEALTIGKLLANNLNGPRRFGCGTIRDWVIGMAVVLPDGRVIRNGGKVVKNVAGFDLCRLFVGARDTLGIIVEATFKLSPLLEAEAHLAKPCESLGQAEALLDKIWDSDLQPTVLDLHRIDGEQLTLVAGFAGPSADVEAQSGAASALGFADEVSLDYDARFRRTASSFISVAPGKLISTLQDLGDESFVARAGNGVIYHTSAKPTEAPSLELQQRVKEIFDPKGVLAG
ncbi:MAG: FAD-binding oxidoreductase [Verrucomicrobiota bacterium]|jgi:FAD/FMN-containing dehydrogenase|nr:FAD-binding oxidoreductase [Verrucomicrobiota bacterium]MDP6250555.1 FAD-binding oxidoreductase [Verrucomicrobiota bacterium]MDP7176947.1 FAD-binding oxidoreductase [Verrucomicrobiota bacterium]MDP7291222.1 FAD-binding oxidoreductase [Verrucomicrobiota bacterium]MDP7440319.1 FAD-binding oxidoreductase [Verrucomicrobiota bacterium]|tara:strand:+ start:2137 stop:3036 length:900 start_codon:yes stop_codon:yes gene_type:complete